MSDTDTEEPTLFALEPATEGAVMPAVQDAQVPAVVAPPTGDPIIDMMFQLVRDPDFSVEKLDALNRVREHMEDRRDEAEFNEAMARCQAAITPIVRDAYNDQTRSRYAKLAAIDAVIKPVYTGHGFNVRHEGRTLANGNIEVTCVVSRGRHSIRVGLDGPADTLGPKGAAVKTVLHGIGSTTTYLRNKTLCMAFNLSLVDPKEDDDGNRGGASHITEKEADDMMTAMLAVGIDNAEKVATFLKTHTNSQPDSAEEVDPKDYARLMNLLTMMARRKKGGE